MSRSRRKTPICGHTMAESDKPWKRMFNRQYRSAVRQAIREEREVMPHPYEVGSADWDAPKDGKQYFGDTDSKEMRK